MDLYENRNKEIIFSDFIGGAATVIYSVIGSWERDYIQLNNHQYGTAAHTQEETNIAYNNTGHYSTALRRFIYNINI